MSKALALLTYEVARGDLQVLDEDLGGVVIEHRADRPDGDPAISESAFQMDDEDR